MTRHSKAKAAIRSPYSLCLLLGNIDGKLQTLLTCVIPYPNHGPRGEIMQRARTEVQDDPWSSNAERSLYHAWLRCGFSELEAQVYTWRAQMGGQLRSILQDQVGAPLRAYCRLLAGIPATSGTPVLPCSLQYRWSSPFLWRDVVYVGLDWLYEACYRILPRIAPKLAPPPPAIKARLGHDSRN